MEREIEYKELDQPNLDDCEGYTRNLWKHLKCESKAAYQIGDKLLCRKHAMEECLYLMVYQDEPDLHAEEFLE